MSDTHTVRTGPQPTPTPRGNAGTAWGLLHAMRPKQWVKNVLVGAAPLAAGRVLEGPVLRATLLAFVTFSVAAAGVYLVNDVRDLAADRAHPRKRFRPVAAGVVPAPLAAVVGAVLLVVAVGLAALLGNGALTGVVATYVVMSLAYCFFLKHQAVIDLAVVASGFLLRAMAGGVAAALPLSQWFLLVAAFGSLFMVAGKRYSEVLLVGEGAGATRRALEQYSASYLRFVWSLSAAVAVTAYSLWAFEIRGRSTGVPWAAISIAPFVLGMLRYAVDVDAGSAGDPEDIVLRDRVLQVLGVTWVGLIALSVLRA